MQFELRSVVPSAFCHSRVNDSIRPVVADPHAAVRRAKSKAWFRDSVREALVTLLRTRRSLDTQDIAAASIGCSELSGSSTFSIMLIEMCGQRINPGFPSRRRKKSRKMNCE